MYYHLIFCEYLLCVYIYLQSCQFITLSITTNSTLTVNNYYRILLCTSNLQPYSCTVAVQYTSFLPWSFLLDVFKRPLLILNLWIYFVPDFFFFLTVPNYVRLSEFNVTSEFVHCDINILILFYCGQKIAQSFALDSFS